MSTSRGESCLAFRQTESRVAQTQQLHTHTHTHTYIRYTYTGFGLVSWCLAVEMGIEPNTNRTNRTRTLFFERTEQNPPLKKIDKNPNRTEPNKWRFFPISIWQLSLSAQKGYIVPWAYLCWAVRVKHNGNVNKPSAHHAFLLLSLTVCIHLISVLYVYFSIACLYFYMYTLFGLVYYH